MPGKRIAIIGSGCSGMGALWALRHRKRHGDDQVHLFEQNERLGGHSNTVMLEKHGNVAAVDIGFISFNRSTYPNFSLLVDSFSISTREIDMSLGFSRDSGASEWAGVGLRGLFAQLANLLDLSFWRMLFEIARFNLFAADILGESEHDTRLGSDECSEEMETLDHYLRRYGYSERFRNDYLVPIVASTWCTGPDVFVKSCPAKSLITFMWNHHLLESFFNPIPWLTFPNGSQQYIRAIMEHCPPDRLFLGTTVQKLTTLKSGSVQLDSCRDETRVYDHVIMAVDATEALRILDSGADAQERKVLSKFQSTTNECVLHSDISLMPKQRAAWASWNYLTSSETRIDGKAGSCKVSVTFDMNRLQGISCAKFGHILVSLNPPHQPDVTTIQASWRCRHPLYSRDAVTAQQSLPLIQGIRNISFAGAWTRYGFHEDGFSSGIAVAKRFCGGQGWPGVGVDTPYTRPKPGKLTVREAVLRALVNLIALLVKPFTAERFKQS